MGVLLFIHLDHTQMVSTTTSTLPITMDFAEKQLHFHYVTIINKTQLDNFKKYLYTLLEGGMFFTIGGTQYDNFVKLKTEFRYSSTTRTTDKDSSVVSSVKRRYTV